jgi:hypothetical protein
MRIGKLSFVKKSHPGYVPGWTEHPGGDADILLENPEFGSLRRIAVCDNSSNPLWDQYEIEEKPGAVIVPYLRSESTLPHYELGLIEQVRPVVKDPSSGKQGDVTSLEFPRGFGTIGESPSKTAIRELGSETGLVARSLSYVGELNQDTAFFSHHGIPIYLAEIYPNLKSHFRPDATERILRSAFIDERKVYRMAADGKIFCGLTMGALGLYMAQRSVGMI